MSKTFLSHFIKNIAPHLFLGVRWQVLLIILIALTVNGCGSAQSPIVTEVATKSVEEAQASPVYSPTMQFGADPSTFDGFLEEAFFAQITRDPELISELGLDRVFGMDNNQLTNVSDAYQVETYQLFQDQLDALRTYDRAELTSDQQLSYDLFEWYLEDWLRGEAFRFHDYPVNQTLGVQNMLIEFMTDRHPLHNLEDAQGYISRLQGFTSKFDQLIEWLQIQNAQGITPPRFVIERVLSQLDWYRSQDADDFSLYTEFVAKLSDLSNISSEQISELSLQAEQAIERNVLPAYDELHTYFGNLLVSADNDDGFWKHPDGEAAYTYWLSHHTTLDLTADEIHELGLQEVERIQGEMEDLFTELGITGDNLVMKMNQVTFYGGAMSLRTNADRQAVLDEYQTLIDQAEQNLFDLFDLRPKADVVVEPVYAPNAPGAYYVSPSLDGSRPGMFYVNMTDVNVPRYRMPTLAYHEAIPGHHFQIAIQQELTGIPSFRTGINYTSYAEGWALYAEYLAWDAGFYDDDPYGNLGRLQDELFRAARLVVDTGIHAKGWSREEAIDYMVDNVGRSRMDMTREVERYIVWPGQATAYKIGMLKILELRERAVQALGDDFDIKEFHNLILGNGAMPLEILERVVDDYIAEQLNE
ncbi:MAG: DUF885 domain-containing protein [Anaerolineaceae bacterium]|nr:MAG: DUF885 domain-containing protein [Anaerolineaceae bacterium]